MSTIALIATGSEVDLAREALYRFLGAAVLEPRYRGWELLEDSATRTLACAAAELLRSERVVGPLGPGELPPELCTLEPLCQAVEDGHAALQEEYTRIFGLVPTKECPPYETEYYPTGDPFFRVQQMADVAGFYRAFGLETSSVLHERPDHLALELEFMAILLMRRRLAATEEEATTCAKAEHDFFVDHLAWWVPAFASGLRHIGGSGFYAALGQALGAFMPLERARLGVEPPRQPLHMAAQEKSEESEECAGCGVGS